MGWSGSDVAMVLEDSCVCMNVFVHIVTHGPRLSTGDRGGVVAGTEVACHVAQCGWTRLGDLDVYSVEFRLHGLSNHILLLGRS